MNQKKCKAARRLAEQKSVGMPARHLVEKSKANPRTAINHIKSTRGIYRFLKGLLRQGYTMETIRKANEDVTQNSQA